MALGPLVGVYCRAAVAAGMQKYHPIPVRLTGFIRLWPRYRVIQRLQYIIIGGGGGCCGTELTEIATRAPLYQALFSLRFSRKLSTS